ncbi:MAG: LLM class flavin-dependent oxidoreductase [Pseudomonadales bacterium]
MSINAGLGIANFPFEDSEGFWRWVDMCESGGIDSLWQSDRIISTEPHLECMSVMAALAGATSRIKFGMNVASLGLRDPVLTAKACATIDVLSNGRLLPAFGVGSALSRDYIATNTPTKGRGKRSAEGLEILSRLWRETEVTFQGEYYQLDKATITPRPIQDPLPLWVGGSAAQAVDRTARWGTGWQAGIESPQQIAPVIEAIKAALPKYNRSIDEDHYGAGFAFRFGDADEPIIKQYEDVLRTRLKREPKDLFAVGNSEDILALALKFHEAGAHKFILRPIASDADDMIKQTKMFIEKTLPDFKSIGS